MVSIGNDWDNFLEEEFQSEYYLKLRAFLKKEYSNYKVYPDMYDIFNAFKYTSYKDTKVVILGQDPYINEGEAHGLSFSVKKNIKIPPSLKNVFKEIEDDIQITMDNHGNLEKWATQGVLLLNTTLTVRSKRSGSHKGNGWETFTDKVIKLLNDKSEPIVFLLWGNPAKAKAPLITNKIHCVLKAAHPSPLARGAYFGSKHFSKTNKFLVDSGYSPIDWHN